MKASIEDDIGAFDPEEWDRLLDPDDLQATHRFIRTCQESGVEDARYRHVLLRDSHGPCAWASLSAFEIRLDLLAPSRTRALGTRLRGRWPSFLQYPLVLCGLPVSFNQSCVRFRQGVDSRPVLTTVDAVARELAAGCGARVICCKEFPAAELGAVQPLTELGYVPAASLPSCHLPLPWPSWQAYQDAMRSGYRRQLRATLRMRSEHGLRVRALAGWGGEIERVFPLYEQVIDRAEYRLEQLNRPFFERLAANLPESTALLVESPAGDLLAAAILLRGPRRATFLIAGMDYSSELRSAAYLNLVLAVIEQSILWRVESLELGQTSWALKMRLGAEATERSLFFRHTSPAGHALLALCLPFLFPRRRFPARRVFRGESDIGVRPSRKGA